MAVDGATLPSMRLALNDRFPSDFVEKLEIAPARGG
jgi:hypothetical protein